MLTGAYQLPLVPSYPLYLESTLAVLVMRLRSLLRDGL